MSTLNVPIPMTVSCDNEAAQINVGMKMTTGTTSVIDKAPYLFRQSGGDNNENVGKKLLDKIVGGTLAYNQILYSQNRTETDVRGTGVDIVYSDRIITLNGTASEWGFNNIKYVQNTILFPPGHVFYISGLTGNVSLEITSNGSPARIVAPFYNDTILKIPNYTDRTASWIRIVFQQNDVFNNDTIEPNVFDLTKMFGSSIADYVYSLEQTTAGAGVAWVKKLFPNAVYPYNEGTLWSVKTSAHIMTGFNQWDEEWELATANWATYVFTPSANGGRLIPKNYISVVSGATYYARLDRLITIICGYTDAEGNGGRSIAVNASTNLFTIPNDVHYIKFGVLTAEYGTTYNHDICINFNKTTGSPKNGDYRPYCVYSYALDYSKEFRGIPKLDANNNLYYDGDEYSSDGTVTRKYGLRSYSSGDETNGSTMITDGTNTVYKLTTPTTETATGFTNPQNVDADGTEEYTDYAYSQSTRDVAIPVGHETQYITRQTTETAFDAYPMTVTKGVEV